ncbi:MAG: UDP-N-acetylmuramoyl-tripeptide--D-alanyl-D-alanine ligase [Pseudomonadota bacterium]
MTVLWSRDEAARATGGISGRDWQATGVSIDTRTLEPGDLFVALKDARDGHDFVADALKKGAAAALVSRHPEGVGADAPLLVVDDVLEALGALGRAARSRFAGRLVAVTGSVGKTGSKEMLRCVLSQQGRTHAAEKSYNNHWGVPLTLARMPADAAYGVIEIGMNAPGEIAPLSRLARPHVALITAVEAVHLAAFRDIRGIALEKGSIMDGLEPGGTVVLNRDTSTYPVLLRGARRRGARPLRFGSQGRPEFQLLEAAIGAKGTSVSARAHGEPFFFRIGARGRHLAMNALGILAAVEALGGDVARAAIRLAQWLPPEGRGARWRVSLGPEGLDGAITLIDESYNANPAAMAATLEVLAAEKPKDGIGRVERGRKIAFLGDMLELGEQELGLHAGLAKTPAVSRLTTIHCAGPRMQALHEALPPAQRGEWFAASSEMAARARKLVDAGDIAMVKGSFGAKMGVVVEAIKDLGHAEPEPSEEG